MPKEAITFTSYFTASFILRFFILKQTEVFVLRSIKTLKYTEWAERRIDEC